MKFKLIRKLLKCFIGFSILWSACQPDKGKLTSIAAPSNEKLAQNEAETETDILNKKVNYFIKLVCDSLKLDRMKAISITPHQFHGSLADYVVPGEEAKREGLFNFINIKICENEFSIADIEKMSADQDSLYEKLEYDNIVLAFNQENEEYYYSLSLPLFNQDSSKFIITVFDLCPGFGGKGENVIFRKEADGFHASTCNSWYH